MQAKIKEIARIRMGYTVRRMSPDDIHARCPIIQIKDVSHEGALLKSGVRSQELPELDERYRLYPGDVLFSARGARNQAAVYDGEPANAVAGSQFFILSVTDTSVDACYLAWYLNQAPAQRHFAEHRTGSRIHAVNKEDLENVAISVPALSIQRKIVELAALAAQERELMAECMEKRKEWLAGCCLKAATGP